MMLRLFFRCSLCKITPDVQVQLGGGPVDVDAQNSVSSKYNGVKIMSPSRRCSRQGGENLWKILQKRARVLDPRPIINIKCGPKTGAVFRTPDFQSWFFGCSRKVSQRPSVAKPPFQPVERQSLNSAKVFEDEFAHLQTENLAPRYV